MLPHLNKYVSESTRPSSEEGVINLIFCEGPYSDPLIKIIFTLQVAKILKVKINCVDCNSCTDFFYLLDSYTPEQIENIDVFITHNHCFKGDTDIVTNTAQKIMYLQNKINSKLYFGIMTFNTWNVSLEHIKKVKNSNNQYFDYYIAGPYAGGGGRTDKTFIESLSYAIKNKTWNKGNPINYVIY